MGPLPTTTGMIVGLDYYGTPGSIFADLAYLVDCLGPKAESCHLAACQPGNLRIGTE